MSYLLPIDVRTRITPNGRPDLNQKLWQLDTLLNKTIDITLKPKHVQNAIKFTVNLCNLNRIKRRSNFNLLTPIKDYCDNTTTGWIPSFVCYVTRKFNFLLIEQKSTSRHLPKRYSRCNI